MRIAVDFDGTIVSDDRRYDDLDTPLTFQQGAQKALRELHAAGHTLCLYSGRANLALREDWRLNPAWASGAEPFDEVRWQRSLQVNKARYEQMLRFVQEHLPGIFSYVDDGRQGKVAADLFIDDKAYRFANWAEIGKSYGEVDAL